MLDISGNLFVDLESFLDVESINELLVRSALELHSTKISTCYAQEQTALPPYAKSDTLGKSLPLTIYDKFATKHLSTEVARKGLATDFQFIFDWIDAQNCFADYGRVMFFLSAPNTAGKIHRDYPAWATHSPSDMFIWISGSAKKQIFLYDEVSDTTEYAKSRAVVFNNCNYHGTINAGDNVEWSLRVDGTFKKEWAERVGIYQHFQSPIDSFKMEV